MHNSTFIYDRLQHYVWALSQEWPSNENGYDIRYLVENYENFDQASLETLQQLIMKEIDEDAKHQQMWWLQVDGALDAIGMMESDGGMISGGSAEINKSSFQASNTQRKKEPYTSRVKANIERVIDHYRKSPVMFQAVAEDMEKMFEAVSGFNAYKDKILEISKWEQQRDNYISDGVTYGSGVLKVHHDKDRILPDDTWFEEKALQGVPLSMDEYIRFHKLVNTHILEWVDTFEIIRSRRARGKASMSLSNSCHPMITRVRQRGLTEVMAEYPHLSGKLVHGAHPVYKMTNPAASLMDYDNRTITQFDVEIKMPVSYWLDVPIQSGDMIIPNKKYRERNAIVKVVMLHNHGIVDMCIDEYHHNQFSYEQWMHTPSFKHGCGIGLAKFGRDTERIFNIMLNGQLRYFGRMVKGGGFFYKGAMDANTIEKRSQEHTWIEIDPKALPQHLQNRPIGDLIQDNRPATMPAVYEQLMRVAEDSTNRAMMVPDASRGVRQGNSGRQELVLTDQAEQVMNSGVARYEQSFMTIGELLHSNIVQFDGDTMIQLRIKDRTGKETEVMLNYPELIEEKYNETEDKWYVMPRLIKNHLRTLRFTTKLGTQSIVPTNPGQRMFFYENLTQTLSELVAQGEPGLLILKWMNQYSYNGVEGLNEFIVQWEAVIAGQKEAAQQQYQQEMQAMQQQEAKADAVKATELAQNQQRLDQNNLREMMRLGIEQGRSKTG